MTEDIKCFNDVLAFMRKLADSKKGLIGNIVTI